MTDRITRTVSASTPDGVSITVADNVDVEVIEKIEANAVKSSVPKVVEVHPSGCLVQFLAITAESYEDLSLVVGAGDPITLDGPITLMGEGVMALLGADTSQMTFTNADAVDDNMVTIMVGRNAEAEGT